MLGHASIVLTADTYTSVLPDVARQTAEAIAAEILTAARTPPGYHRQPGLTTASPWPHRAKGRPFRNGPSGRNWRGVLVLARMLPRVHRPSGEAFRDRYLSGSGLAGRFRAGTLQCHQR